MSGTAAEQDTARAIVITGASRGIGAATALLAAQRGGQPEEVAAAILWVLSDRASYSTGTFLDVSGGR